MKAFASDADLLAACLAQNPRAQRCLYDQYAGQMLATIRRYVRAAPDAEDVLATGFVKVFRYLPQYAGRGPLGGWIRQVMIHEALKFLRRRGPLTVSLSAPDGPGAPLAHPLTRHLATAATAETDLAAADLWALLERLPAGYRTVFTLYAVEGCSHPQIAAALGISEGTSKSQLFKARGLLQRQLAALHREPPYALAA